MKLFSLELFIYWGGEVEVEVEVEVILNCVGVGGGETVEFLYVGPLAI